MSKQIDLFAEENETATEKKEIPTLTEKLLRYQHEYYILNKPSVSDREYDSLFDRLAFLEKKYPELADDNSPIKRVGSDLSSSLPEVRHTIPVLSLDKVYDEDELIKWIEKTRKACENDLVITIEEKIDGISIVLYYEKGLLKKAVTRGNGETGNDVTDNVRTIGSVPLRLSQPLTLAARGEIYLPLKSFSDINNQLDVHYANPRNLAAGTIRRIKSAEVSRVPLDMFIYEGFIENSEILNHHEIFIKLEELGFRINRRIKAFTDSSVMKEKMTEFIPTGAFSEIEDYIKKETEERKNLEYEIDGLVIKISNIADREKLGYTGHHPRWAIAYKFESSEAESTVESIDIQIGRTGRATPVARITPVQISGSVVSNVTLHNQDYINYLSLAIGDRVTVSKRGDVIPAVENVVDKNNLGNPVWKMPDSCPFCGSVLAEDGAHLFCRNKTCPERVRGQILFFASRDQMNIENFGYETIDLLVREGIVRKVYDIYEKDMSVLMDYEGFGEKKIELIKKGIDKSREKPFRTVLSSLGIPDIGPKVCELLVESGFNSIEKILETACSGNTEKLLSINGIGEKTAESFMKYFSDQEIRETIRRLESCGLSMKEEIVDNENTEKVFSGQSWCVTGSFTAFRPRSLAEGEIKKRGGSIVSQVSGKTTHLLCGESPGSKYNAAVAIGVKIVSEDEFIKLLR